MPDYIPTLIGEMNHILGRTGKLKNNKPYLDHYINKHENVPLWVIMNNLDLGQAFRFYDYLPESIRFPIARRFQALYAETHFVPKRITHKDLKNAFDHIKDFRNRCAHDEQLHCARIDKSGSTKFKVQLIESISILFSQIKRFFETNLAIFWKNLGRIVLQSRNGLFQRAVVHGCVYVHRHAERRVPR